MKTTLFLLIAVMLTAACNKPSEDDCRKAVERIRELTGTNKLTDAPDDIEGAVRSCRGNASKESVKCALEAGSLEQLERCGIMKKEDIDTLQGVPPASGSGTASGTSK